MVILIHMILLQMYMIMLIPHQLPLLVKVAIVATP